MESGKRKILSVVIIVALVVSVLLNIYQAYSASSPNANFTFTWGPDTQSVVQGTLKMEITLRIDGENLTVIIKVNDDDYDTGDYVGLGFMNASNPADYEAYALYANNKTIFPAVTDISGRTVSTWGSGLQPGPHKVTFDPKTGYTFVIKFPWTPQNQFPPKAYNPIRFIRRADEFPNLNILNVGFEDGFGRAVFTRFGFTFP